MLGNLVIQQHARLKMTSREGCVEEDLFSAPSMTDNLLFERLNQLSLGNLQNEERSTEPTKLFDSIFSNSKLLILRNDPGTSPVNSFMPRSKSTKHENATSNSCIGPESSFSERYKCSNVGRVNIDVGIFPAK
jgi:hypothetical protein